MSTYSYHICGVYIKI